MITIGNNVKVFAKTFEDAAFEQVKEMSEYEAYKNSKIRIMPDAHAGKGCVIGTTIKLDNVVTPNLVGVDIGCGMLAAVLDETEIDLAKLDNVIRTYVPSGFSIHENALYNFDISNLRAKGIDYNYMMKSIGTLGGGNHFIEVNKASNGKLVIVIHTGSRNLGVKVCDYYQNLALETLKKNVNITNIKETIERLKSEGRHKEIESTIKKLKEKNENVIINKDLAHLTGDNFDDYIHDMKIVQKYAAYNRQAILHTIVYHMNLTVSNTIETIHNYIDTDAMILRKGAVRANLYEPLIIPMNMRDGSLICVGKGNADWNNSAPHGAGRLMSRIAAKENITMDEFKNSMSNVYTTSVCEATLDEAPQAYKNMNEIMELITDTVTIIDVIKPIYNFKAN